MGDYHEGNGADDVCDGFADAILSLNIPVRHKDRHRETVDQPEKHNGQDCVEKFAFQKLAVEKVVAQGDQGVYNGNSLLVCEQPVGLSINWLQIRPFGSYLSSFSTNSYGYYSQLS